MSSTPWSTTKYPPARRSDHVDVYNSEARGKVEVYDPYQWLEQSSQETDEWTAAQEAFTRSYLDLHPDRLKLEKEIKKNMDYAKFTPVTREGGRCYWYYNSGLQSQSVLYRSATTDPRPYGDGAEVFFDPNLLSTDGTVSLAIASFSLDAKYWAYGVSISGSDFCTIYVRSTDEPLTEANGERPTHHDKRLPDEIRFVKFSGISWTHDNKGFFYQRYPDHGLATEDKAGAETQSDLNAMLYYHRIGTSQSTDVLVIKDGNNPEWLWGVAVDEVEGKYLQLYVARDTSRKHLLWITDLSKNEIGQNMKWDKLINEFEAEYSIICNDGSLLYIRTNKDAPQYKVITIDLEDETRTQKDFIPEDPNAFLHDVRAIHGNNFVIIYKRNVRDELYVYNLVERVMHRLADDFVGAASITGKQEDPEFFVSMSGFTTPGIVAKYDFREEDHAQRWSVVKTTEVHGLKPDEFESRQVWYESKDGTKIPMFIVRHKSTPFDGNAPAIQYGYGGFSASINPFFSASILTFLQRYGAIFAVPNIRGGSEFGEDWHLGGTRERKVNCFDDFIAATEYLVKNKYAGHGKVAINGASNGGLLVAACALRAPEGLLGAAVAEVGVLDLLKFTDFTIGKAWTSDYGDPHDPHDFDFIYPISPVHNVSPEKILPPTILLTADHDDRVVPLHSFKFAATLQHTLPNNPNPLLLRVDKKAGHGAGKATDKRIKESADKWGFVAQSLGLVWKND